MPTFKKRRQKHSCEECRQSKKACDGYLVNLQARPAPASTSSDVVLPCSYCVRTKKECSLNKNWSFTDAERQSMAVPCGGDAESFFDTSSDPRSRFPISESSVGPSFQTSLPAMGPGRNPSLSAANLTLRQGDSVSEPHKTASLPMFEGDPYAASSATEAPLPLTSYPSYPASQTTTEFATGLQQREDLATGSLDPPDPPGFSSATSAASAANSRSLPTAKRRKRRLESSAADERHQTTSSISPYDPSHNLMLSCNSHLVSQSFLQIYHDVLENHLHCLLDEEVCPFKTWNDQRQQVLSSERKFPFTVPHTLSIGSSSTPSTNKSPTGSTSAPKYSDSWSNQMYRRVIDLERAAQRAGLISLTKEQSQTAARAMNSTIMAYAAQWSQGKRRRERFSNDIDDPQQEVDDTVDEFEQHLQSTLWESAKQTLDSSLQIESFKVIFAEIIFGFTQKPLLAVDSPGKEPLPHEAASGDFRGFFINQVKELLNEEKSAIYLRSAIRKSYYLKMRFDSMQARHDQSLPGSPWLSNEQRGTVGLLYWFVVMIDTVLSSMNSLPPIIGDEDCQPSITDTPPPPPASSSTSLTETSMMRTTTLYWDLPTFAQDNPNHPSVVRWPCSQEDAYRAVTRAAAIKILLFRSISYLQGALRRCASSHHVEEKITYSMKVCSYWNMTHGVLFRDFIDDYDSVPTRIRSWFPFVCVHWHLATQLLADLVDMVDENGYGTDIGKLSRANAQITGRMRKTSATELSELARVTTPQDESRAAPYEHLPSFHFAVNEGPGLTEPWTLLLIKALSQAAIFHLVVMEGEYRNSRQPPGEMGGPCPETLQQVRACVRALWFMGRRSSSARHLSLLFSRWIKRVSRPQTQSILSSSPSVGRAAA